jgi:hypothetical protein
VNIIQLIKILYYIYSENSNFEQTIHFKSKILSNKLNWKKILVLINNQTNIVIIEHIAKSVTYNNQNNHTMDILLFYMPRDNHP